MELNSKGMVDLNEEEINELDKMLNGIASRYNGWAGLDKDSDIVPELWCKVMKIINKKQEVNMNYLARACYFTCIDLYDKTKRNNDRNFSAEPSLFDTLLDESNDRVGFKASANTKPNTVEDYTEPLVIELLNLFPKGTKERTYVEMNIQWTGMSGGSTDDIQFKGKEYKTAIACGYASDTSSGYRSMVSRIRTAIKDYYTEYKLSEDELNSLKINDILGYYDHPNN